MNCLRFFYGQVNHKYSPTEQYSLLPFFVSKSLSCCHLMTLYTRCLFAFVATLVSCFHLQGQTTFPKDEPKYNHPDVFVITNAIIHPSSDKVIENGMMLIEKNKIVQVGKTLSYPRNAVVIDMKGKHIYPSFIDLFSTYGVPTPHRNAGGSPQYETLKKGASNWNECIKAETQAIEAFKHDAGTARELRGIGFGTVLTHVPDGLMQGTGALVNLNEEKENFSVIKPRISDHFSFRKGSSAQEYPSSLMGNIALLRQTFMDAQWYAQGGSAQEFNPSLNAINENAGLVHIFDAGDKYNLLRAQKIASEFGYKFIYRTNGSEYQRIKEISALNSPLIVPVNFPEAYDVEDYYDAQNVSLAELKHWELAPGNAGILYKNGIVFCFTAEGLRDKQSFLNNVRKAVTHGLPASQAIKALTETPALLAGVSDILGTLDKNKLASFIVTNQELFTDKCMIMENWVAGKRFEIKTLAPLDVRGEYSLNVNQNMYTLSVKGDIASPTGEVKQDTIKVSATIKKDIGTISVSFIAKDKNLQGPVRLSGTINYDSGSWDGTGQLPNGSTVSWTAIRKERFKEESRKKTGADTVLTGTVTFPQMAYGFDSLPVVETYLIRNATVWTNEAEGILKNADVLIKDGKIAKVGTNLTKPPKCIEIDGTGKHVTSGIIDEHSHIAISHGVNEGGQNISAEVSIGDVLNPDDINIYRQLSGGVTAAQLLHGSANPIGGQSAIIKLRWGSSPEEMKIAGADGFIKFALGENVKQSNWGENYNMRYPQTRMGVEQVFYDAFYKARAYEKAWKEYLEKAARSKTKTEAPRKDIENEILLEILNGKRFITCHSYVQSEINMLMHVADSMGFKINTFTHVLEGFKIAEKLKAHGANASTFSDWWAYKYEVYDAIPFNAAILHKMGINVSMNSDDAEMARRLNQEAAKAIKYGGVSEEEAWKMVTLNPAKMLHLDKQMGSLKEGKDGDVVIWSDNPLSIYAMAEKTFIDGKLYFDRDRDLELRKKNTAEKLRIIQKLMEAKAGGEKTIKPTRKGRRLYHCDTMGETEEVQE